MPDSRFLLDPEGGEGGEGTAAGAKSARKSPKSSIGRPKGKEEKSPKAVVESALDADTLPDKRTSGTAAAVKVNRILQQRGQRSDWTGRLRMQKRIEKIRGMLRRVRALRTLIRYCQCVWLALAV